MRALLAGLEDEFGPAKMFRPNRDVRFSKDKAPYKTHQGALVPVSETRSASGTTSRSTPTGLLAGGGWRSHEHRRRSRATGQPSTPRPRAATLQRLVDGARGRAASTSRATGSKTRPRGVPADHPRLELMRARSLMVFRRFGAPDWLATPRAADEVRGAWRAVRPLAELGRRSTSPGEPHSPGGLDGPGQNRVATLSSPGPKVADVTTPETGAPETAPVGPALLRTSTRRSRPTGSS